MRNQLQVFHLKPAQEFKESLNAKEEKKLDIAIRKTEEGFIGQWFIKLTGTDGIWEFRIEVNKKWIRLLGFWDTQTDPQSPLIITTNGFFKKSNRTPTKEIEKAEKLRKEYFSRIE